MKTREELYADSKKYVWHLEIQNPENGKKRFRNGISLANNVIRGMVILQEEHSSSPYFSTLAGDKDLRVDDEIYAISTYIPQREVGHFLVGYVAFPFSTSKNLAVKVSDDLCRTYMLPKGSGFLKSSNNRIIGNLINRKSMEMGKRKDELTTLTMEYFRSLYHTLPIIHCDGFPPYNSGAGGPVIDNAGMIIGILSGGLLPFTSVVIHSSAVKTFVEKIWPAFEKQNHNKNLGEKKFRGYKDKDDNDRKKKKHKTKYMEAHGQ